VSRNVIYASAFALALAACAGNVATAGGDNVDPSTPEVANLAASAEPWTNTAMQAVVARKCAASGCHDGSRSPNLKNISESAMKADTKSLREVTSGKMPKRLSMTSTEESVFTSFYE
jgi:hypothetical protein